MGLNVSIFHNFYDVIIAVGIGSSYDLNVQPELENVKSKM